SIGLSGLHVAADEVVPETESVETIIPENALQVDSVEEAVSALGMDTETAEMNTESAPVESATEDVPAVEAAEDTAITTTLAEETEVVESVTTTAEVGLVQEESQTAVTTTTMPAATGNPVVTTIIDKPGTQGAVPLNYYDDIVLMLDVSGSMETTQLNNLKEAAILVCNTFLTQKIDATVSIVGFDSNVYTFDKTSDLNTVIANINSLVSGSRTDMYDAMVAVKLILEDSTGTKKAVIIMTDGVPNEGSSQSTIDYSHDGYQYDDCQNAALQFDEENLKTDATVYSVGIFDSSSSVSDAAFVRDLASNPIYNRTIESTEDLKAALREMFSDIPEEGKVESPITDTPVDGTTSTPKTADKGLGVVVAMMAIAGLGIVLGKRK
ncbi:MAG: VWA domain-containing protein, partial [Ruminococcus sp.]